MRKYLLSKRKKGMSLPMILIVITVVLSMIVTLLSLSVQQLKATKSENHIEHTYFAGDSMIEMTISRISKFLNNPANLSSITYNGYANYASAICTELNKESNNIVNKKENINIGASGQNAVAVVSRIDLVNAVQVNNKVQFYLRINTTTDYYTDYKAGSKEITAIQAFEVSIPTQKPKLAAINSIGDLVATGTMESTIKGDVKVYGSAPAEPVKVEQEYYGGIFSQRDALLRIEGNAFVRSFIRTGIKDDTRVDSLNNPKPDNSRIYITKSAIAQGLHSFGWKSFIYVHKDAYTFDDVEMNAEDSAIIINRNLFALEQGDGIFHDSSSAIVNSAPLYFLNSEESFKSKIVVNGPVYLNGGTFRVGDDGNILYKGHTTNGIVYYGQPQVEDGSLAWDTTEDAPYYTTFEDPLTSFYQAPGKGTYHDQIKNNRANVRGYGNIIQAFSMLTNDDNVSIKTFIDGKLRSAMDEGYSVGLLSNIASPSDNKIMGFTRYEIAANGKMYFMDRQNESASDLKRPTNTLGEYSDAYLNYEKVHKNGSGYTRQQWENDWDVAMNTPNKWDDTSTNLDAYNNKIPDIFNKIKAPLYDLTQEFVKREIVYPVAGVTASVNHTYTTLPGNTESTFKTYQNKLAALSIPSNTYFIDVSNDNKTEVDLAAKVATNKNMFYVFFNSDPDQDLVISDAIKGLVFSAGRVILKDGGELRGCIIAAGKGYDGVAVTGSQADHIPKIDLSNVDLLNDGTFAGVLFQGSATIDFHPDPSTGDPESAQDVFFDEFATTNGTGSNAFVSQLKAIFE